MLSAPVIGEVQALIIMGEPLVQELKIELQHVIPQLIDQRFALPDIGEQIFESTELLHFLEELDPRAPRVIIVAPACHVARIHPGDRRFDLEFRPAIGS